MINLQRGKKDNNIYVLYDNDYEELPIFIGDLDEMSAYLNRKRTNIKKSIYKGSTRLSGYRYSIVE